MKNNEASAGMCELPPWLPFHGVPSSTTIPSKPARHASSSVSKIMDTLRSWPSFIARPFSAATSPSRSNRNVSEMNGPVSISVHQGFAWPACAMAGSRATFSAGASFCALAAVASARFSHTHIDFLPLRGKSRMRARSTQHRLRRSSKTILELGRSTRRTPSGPLYGRLLLRTMIAENCRAFRTPRSPYGATVQAAAQPTR